MIEKFGMFCGLDIMDAGLSLAWFVAVRRVNNTETLI